MLVSNGAVPVGTQFSSLLQPRHDTPLPAVCEFGHVYA